MKHIIILLVCFTAIFSDEKILAKIKDRVITQNDFIKRAEYTIRPTFCKSDNYIHKKIDYKDKKRIVPNLKGKTLKEALRLANAKGLILSPNTISGKIIWQSLRPGRKISDNEICEVKLTI